MQYLVENGWYKHMPFILNAYQKEQAILQATEDPFLAIPFSSSKSAIKNAIIICYSYFSRGS